MDGARRQFKDGASSAGIYACLLSALNEAMGIIYGNKESVIDGKDIVGVKYSSSRIDTIYNHLSNDDDLLEENLGERIGYEVESSPNYESDDGEYSAIIHMSYFYHARRLDER